MFLIPLALGSLAVVFPFMALVLLMFFCGKNFESCYQNPLKTIMPTLIVPLSLLAFSRDPATIMMVCDATFGVGLIALGFVYMVKKQMSIYNSFAAVSAAVIGYGMLRALYFDSLLQTGFEQALQTVQNSFLMVSNDATNQLTINWMRLLLPSMWIVQMLVALFLGLIVFQKQLGISFSFSRFSISKYYSLLLLALIPMYIIKNMHLTLLNGLIAYSFLPLIQGIGVMTYKLSKIVQNSFFMSLIVVLVLINAVSYIVLTLLGIADQWLDLRKLETGEITHESNNA